MSRVIALAAVVGLVLSFGQPAAAQPEEGQYYRLVCVNSKKALGVGGSKKVSEVMQIGNMPNAEGQQWKFVKVGKFYKIINRKSGLALNVANASLVEGDPVIQWDAENDDTNQQWSLEKKGNHYVIRARHSGLVLDVADASKERKAPVIQFTYSDTRSQLFELVPVK